MAVLACGAFNVINGSVDWFEGLLERADMFSTFEISMTQLGPLTRSSKFDSSTLLSALLVSHQ